jgi:hypothetical protein
MTSILRQIEADEMAEKYRTFHNVLRDYKHL